MKATIKFPVLTVSFKDVELTIEDIETLENCTESEKAKIIEKYLSDDEMEHTPFTIQHALEYDCAAIKIISS